MTLNWVKPRGRDSGQCVEVATIVVDSHTLRGVRNSQVPSEEVWFSDDEWAAFVDSIKHGHFDA